MKTNRTIVVKTLLNADEFVAFEKECISADVPQSRALRDLAKSWIANRQRNGRRIQERTERPVYGHNMAMFLPSRANGNRGMYMRL